MPRDGSDTRDRLLRAAEYLFARSGIDVPIREIHERAGQRNASATQYHFGSKQDLVRAVIDRHALSDAEIDRPDLISFEAEIDVIRSAVPYLSKRELHERALAGLTFITLQVAERARIIDDEPGEPPLDEEAFITNLVDMTTALLTAPACAAQTAV